MSSPVTVDASVFVNAFSPTEQGSDQSAEFIAMLRSQGIPIIQPTLLLPEGIAFEAQKKGNLQLALRLGKELRNFSGL